jgi:hypothetical protein
MQAMLAWTTYHPGEFTFCLRSGHSQDNPIGTTEIVSWITVVMQCLLLAPFSDVQRQFSDVRCWSLNRPKSAAP